VIMNVICKIHCFGLEKRCDSLGLNHAISHLFKCLFISFSNVILLIGVREQSIDVEFHIIKEFEFFMNV
jgi:hypothetical protein